MRPWVKLWTGLVSDLNFRRLSFEAKATFLICLAIAGRCDRGGLLAERTGPVTAEEIAEATGLPFEVQQVELDALVRAEFIRANKEGFRIRNWDVYQPPAISTERVRDFRERKRNADETVSSAVTKPLRNRFATSQEEDRELDNTPTPSGVAPRRSLKPDLPPVVDFGDLEPDVAAFVANAAGENKSGKITEGRIAAIRLELMSLLDVMGRVDFAHGLRAANSAGAPNANYVKKAGRNSKFTPLRPRYDPNEGKCSSPDHASKFAALTTTISNEISR